jgi:predicted nucleotidyltransferase
MKKIMKIVGILTEFNPFHNGHAWFLSQLRARFGADAAIVCVMSGNFVQRGEPALLEKHLRAEAALRGGADLILELPVARCLSSAEGFAGGGMTLLRETGCVEAVAFGSECGDMAALEQVALCLDSAAYREELQRFLAQGRSFPACRRAAVAALLGEGAAALLDSPNNNLGVEYCRAIGRLDWDCDVITLPRCGAPHDSAAGEGGILSASAVRARLLAGDWTAVEEAVPPEAYALYREEFSAGRAPVTMQGAQRLILSRVRTMEEAAFAALPDCGEGLHHRFYRAAREALSVEELLAQVKTKRYTHARLRRILMCAWLGLDAAAVAESPAYLRPLGFNGRGREILARMRKTATLPILVKGADVRKLDAAAQRQFAREARATELFSLLYPDLSQARPGAEWRKGAVILSPSEGK